MGSKAYTISKGSIAYHAPGSSYLRECQDMGALRLSAIPKAAEHEFPFRRGKADPHDLQAQRSGICGWQHLRWKHTSGTVCSRNSSGWSGS